MFTLLLATLSLYYISGIPVATSGSIQKEVRRFLVEHPTEDTTFVFSSVYTIESAPSFSDDKIKECSECWPADITSRNGIIKTKECSALICQTLKNHVSLKLMP